MRASCLAVIALLALLGAACASSKSAAPPRAEPRDRTDDPAMVAAREAARPEFETQADALAAGVYEEFEHPDSVGAAARAVRPTEGQVRAVAPVIPPGDDPSTEELLGTLAAPGPYNGEAAAGRESPPAEPTAVSGEWTLQLGAFESETGALVRIRQIAAEFPSLPRWYEREAGTVRVFVGRFPDRAAAERERARLAAAGYPDVWVTAVR